MYQDILILKMEVKPTHFPKSNNISVFFFQSKIFNLRFKDNYFINLLHRHFLEFSS